MRVGVIAVLLALALAVAGTAVRVAGDIGPGENGTAFPASRLAGDIGPGENG
jgi:hypothetical protein